MSRFFEKLLDTLDAFFMGLIACAIIYIIVKSLSIFLIVSVVTSIIGMIAYWGEKKYEYKIKKGIRKNNR